MKLLCSILLLATTLQAHAYDLKGKWGLGLDYGFPYPIGTEVQKDSLEDDWSAAVKLRYHLTNRQALQLEYDILRFVEQGSEDDIGAGQDLITLNYLISIFNTSGRWYNYIALGAGVGSVKNDNLNYKGEDEYWRSTYKVGLGSEFFVNRYFNLGLNVDYHYTARRDSASNSTELHVLNPSVNANFYFGSVAMADSDKDGVSDTSDKCGNTPYGAYVDSEGCTDSQKDSDNDGVNDRDDKCASTPQSEKVDANGCASSQKDSDNDGVSDKLDQCPNTAVGSKVNSAGCTEKESVEITLNITFPSSKATIDPKYEQELIKVANFLNTYKDTEAEIEGHSDSRGARSWNIKLSQMRASAVKDYLVQNHNVDPSRLSAKGYGPDRPIADNNTTAGRKANRRVIATFRSSK
jgi:OOP family OmpA-OmpF porin